MVSNARITIADVAEAANVSKMSVSRVLNGKSGVSEPTRQRILEAMATLGYVASPAARNLRGMSNIVGLVVPDITTAYMGEVIRGISQAAERLNYGLMLYSQGNAAEHTKRTTYYASLLSDGLADGVLMIVPYDYEVLVSAFQDHNLPYVLIDHHSSTSDEPAITATNRKGILDAMRHLMALGHQRIGFITGRMDMGCAQDRLQGYRDALAEVGLPFDPALVREGNFWQPSGFAQARALLQLKPRPTAIVASNDVMAFGVMDAVKDVGLRIGSDISVVGFDDIPMASQVYPPLTTVRQPMAQMGEEALDLLVTLLQGRTPRALRRELTTELIIRESTGRCRRDQAAETRR
jgi:LacI family transcriptional regulator